MDEQIPQQPIDLSPKESHKIRSNRLKGSLEKLPTDVKVDMENFMCKVNPNKAKKYMVEKYSKDYPILTELSTHAFHNYFKRHKAQITSEVALQQLAVAPTPEILGVIDAIADANTSLSDKKAALTALYNASEARLKLMLARQTNFIDPYLEKLILDNRKEQHAILKTVSTLNEQLSKDTDKEFLEELRIFTTVLLSSVVNTYKLVHQPNLTKFSEFSSALDESLTATFKAYRQSKEQVRLEKK
jgi:hypothetical protein